MSALFNRRSAWLTLFCLFISPFLSFSQEQLSGVVAEETEGGKLMPLFGVNVYWLGTTIGTTTDENGVFKITDDHTNHNLIFSYVGYANDTVNIVNHEDLMVVLKNARVIDEVEIVYRKQSTSLSFMDPKHTEILSEKELFKAACCNLSESFETNATVDASYTDAISGSRQIQMLGLAGIYTQITSENMPSNRGLASIYSLTYIPGAWLDNISISKGTGSVVNGYESITGQINTEIRKPEADEKLYVNAYASEGGRLEANLDYKIRLNEKWSTSFLLHGRTLQMKNDVNSDGFLDMPLNESMIGMNRWKYQGIKGVESELTVKYIDVSNKGGQSEHNFDKSFDEQQTWGMLFNTQRLELTGKVGFVFPQRKYSSVGLQVMGIDHKHNSYFGNRIYDGKEKNYYTNLIYQNIIGNSNHKYKVGVSYMYDDYNESFDSLEFKRTEMVPGAFGEYTYSFDERLTIVAGARVDQHNLYGMLFNPRMHLRYGFRENTVVRLAMGSGTRVANVLAENSGYLASSRTFIFQGMDKAYGLEPEKAVNLGISLTQKFKLDFREGDIILDFYRTEFLEQTVVDIDKSAREVNFYNLKDGRSFANSFQIQVNYEVIKRLDVRLAYRYYDVRTDYKTGLLQKAMLPTDKGFINVAYETRKNQNFGLWRFDLTQQIIGRQRLPSTIENSAGNRLDEYSPAYGLLMAQVTRVFNKQFEIYLGGENLTDFRQSEAIISPEDPYGNEFDASIIWAPVFGRMIYAGLRFRVK